MSLTIITLTLSYPKGIQTIDYFYCSNALSFSVSASFSPPFKKSPVAGYITVDVEFTSLLADGVGYKSDYGGEGLSCGSE